MPSYYKPGTRKGNRFYIVRGRVERGGRVYEVTTPCRDKACAEDYWAAFKRTIRAERRADPRPDGLTFADAAAKYMAANPDLPGNETYYLRRLEAHLGPRRLLSHADANGNEREGITLADLHAAAHALYPGRLPQTKNRQALTPAASVLHYMADAGLMPWLRVRKFREIDPDRPVVLPAKAETAIAAARAKGDRELAAAILTLAYQGWRITEMLRVERARVDWRARTLKRWVSKSGRWRTVAIEPGVIKAWRKIPAHGDGRLFRWQNRFAFYRSIDALGLAFHYRPHMSRRGFATDLKNRAADTADIAEAGQWEDERSVKVYVAGDIQRQRNTLAKLRRKPRAKRKAG